MSYLRLYDSFSASETTGGRRVTVIFGSDTGSCVPGTHTVPNIGDNISTQSWFNANTFSIFDQANNWVNCKCIEKNAVMLGCTNEKITCVFSTEPAQDEYTETSLRIGGEWFALEEEGDENALTFYISNNKFEGPYKIFIPVADYEVTTIKNSFEEAVLYGNNTQFWSDIVSYVRADGTSFTGDGHWLLAGVDIQQIIDRDGNTKFRVTEQYKHKAFVTNGAMPFTSVRVGWNVLYDRQEKIWNLVEPTPYQTLDEADWPRTMPFV